MRLHVYNITVRDLYPSALASAYERLLEQAEAADPEMPDIAFASASRGFASRSSWLARAPDEADRFWVPIWLPGVCFAAEDGTPSRGNQPRTASWARAKGEVTAWCKALAPLAEWLLAQPSWRRREGSDHVWFNNRAPELDASSERSMARVTRRGLFLTIEDRSERAQWCQYRRIAVPYHAKRSRWWADDRPGPAADPLTARPLLVSWVGSVHVGCHLYATRKAECTPVKPNPGPQRYDNRGWQLRAGLVRHLYRLASGEEMGEENRTASSGNAVASRFYVRAVDGNLTMGGNTSGEGNIVRATVALEALRKSTQSKGKQRSVVDLPGAMSLSDLYRRTLLCPAPQGDSLSSRRIVQAVLALCIPVLFADDPQRLIQRLPFRQQLNYTRFALFAKPAVLAREEPNPFRPRTEDGRAAGSSTTPTPPSREGEAAAGDGEPPRLRAIGDWSAERLGELRAGLRQARRALSYSEEGGEHLRVGDRLDRHDAVEATLRDLARELRECSAVGVGGTSGV